jgi:hypothetical protein
MPLFRKPGTGLDGVRPIFYHEAQRTGLDLIEKV